MKVTAPLVSSWSVPKFDDVGFANEIVGVAPVKRVMCGDDAANAVPPTLCVKLPPICNTPFVSGPDVPANERRHHDDQVGRGAHHEAPLFAHSNVPFDVERVPAERERRRPQS